VGRLSAIFGFVVLVAPGAGALALIWVIGAYAILFGICGRVLAAAQKAWPQADDTR
jgi:uncharacterized membrane protein HdeD (DUF308 family)